jgi:methionine-rich copper-binding protein CopC
MHSSMQVWHIAMQASSIAIIDAGVIPCMRIIARIIVLHMSAQFMHAGAHDISCVEHTVHACSQAEQASIQACSTAMSIVSMPGIDIMSFDMASIIMASIRHRPSAVRPAGQVLPPAAMLDLGDSGSKGPDRLDRVMSQGIHTSFRARALALVAAFLVAVAALVLPASPAVAHDELLGSDPAAGSTVDGLPAQISFTFSGIITTDPGASEVSVTDASGAELAEGAPTAQDNELTQPLAGAASGPLTVLWKVVSSDGHPISGEFTFTVSGTAESSAAAEPSPSETELPDDNQVDAGATLFANLLPVVIAAGVVAVVVVAIVLATRRRRT